jgi:hypothetical protein
LVRVQAVDTFAALETRGPAITSISIDYRNSPPLFDVGAVWRVLWSRKLLITAVTATLIALAFAYVTVTKPSFVASAAVLIDPRDLKRPISTSATILNTPRPALSVAFSPRFAAAAHRAKKASSSASSAPSKSSAKA